MVIGAVGSWPCACQQDSLGSLLRSYRCLPRLRAPRGRLLSLHEHPGAILPGYLGDIGVPVSDAPMDFAASFEAYVGGGWYTFDARNNMRRIGRLLIARGRDDADVAISTTFGPNTLSSFTVWTEKVVPGALPQAAPRSRRPTRYELLQPRCPGAAKAGNRRPAYGPPAI